MIVNAVIEFELGDVVVPEVHLGHIVVYPLVYFAVCAAAVLDVAIALAYGYNCLLGSAGHADGYLCAAAFKGGVGRYFEAQGRLAGHAFGAEYLTPFLGACGSPGRGCLEVENHNLSFDCGVVHFSPVGHVCAVGVVWPVVVVGAALEHGYGQKAYACRQKRVAYFI